MSDRGDNPLLAIILLTYQRTEYAVRTVRAIHEHLHYDGRFSFCVSDDGSDEAHLDRIFEVIDSTPGLDWFLKYSERVGYGRLANASWSATTPYTPVTLWVEDDWEMGGPLDITPYIRLLCEREDVGMIRLGHMPVGLELESMGYAGRMYLNVKPTRQYMFSGNPHLKHVRFTAYGSYPEGRNPGETEVAYDAQIRGRSGPQIWWPLAIGDTYPWRHIGREQSY